MAQVMSQGDGVCVWMFVMAGPGNDEGPQRLVIDLEWLRLGIYFCYVKTLTSYG